jgi:AsmA family
MAEIIETPQTPQPPKKRRRLLKALFWVLGIFIILLVAVYFVGTSSAFLKGVILPRVSKSLNAEITVTDASIHPFKEVVLRNLVVKTTGDEPLVTAPEVHAKYSLMDIIGGKIHVEFAELNSPRVVLIQNADGTSNLDPLTKGQTEKPKAAGEKKTEQPGKPSKPPQIDIKKVALNDATIRQINYKNGHKDVTELSHVNVTIDDLKNGQSGKLTLSGDVKMESNPPAPETNGVLEAKLKGNFSFALGADLKPSSVQGNTRLEVTRAVGGLSELGSLASDLDCDVTPTEIKQVALHFAKGVTRLGEVRVNGPFDMNKMEGKLAVQVLSIDKQVLNLAGAASGIDFGSTTLNSTNEIVLAKSGTEISVVGQVGIGKLQLTRAKQTTPTLDLVARYNMTVYQSAKTALLREFTLSGTQKGNQLLQGELANPMTFAWGESSTPVSDSTLTLAVNNLDLADWKPFLGDAASSGNVNVKMQLLSQQAGKQLTFSLNSQIANLTANLGSNQLSQANITLQVNGRAVNLNQFNLTDYQLQLAQQNQPLVTVSGAGNYDKGTDMADLQVNVKAAVGRLLQVLQPDAVLTSGTADLTAHVVQRQGTQGVTGNLALADLTGKFGKNQFNAFGATMDLDVAKTPQEIQIHRVAGKLTENGKPGGTFDVSGTYGTNKAAQLTAKLSDFNQEGLRAFLEPMLADKKLVSIAINGTANVQLNPQGDSAVKADFKVANLVVNDPQNQIPATPLEAKMTVDASVQKQVADIRQFQITLTPTQRAKNELQLKGRIDMTDTNAIQGNLKLFADSLDFTSYYDLFAGESKTPEKKPAPAPKQTSKPAASHAASEPAVAEKEPDAVKLPMRNFTAEVNIGHCYLREVDIANFQTTTKIDGGHVVVKPLQLALNGAPVNANVDLDLGVPGYKYDTSLGAQAIPLAPLVNTFAPERKGQIGGTLTANWKLSGAGTTGANLQKTLAGQFDVTSTNLNLSVVNIKSKILKGLVNVIGAIPELITNPAALVGTAMGKGGLSDELAKSPIDSIDARGDVASGKVNLQKAVVQSAAFLAEARGTVTLADVLTNSALQVPVSISLSHGIAKNFGLAAADASTNTTYVKLPDFYTMKGTVGDPKNDINKLALAKVGGKALLGVGSNLGGSTGQLLREAGSLFGTSPGTNSQTATNKPPDKSGGLLRGLGGVISGALGQTNAPATNSPKR